MAEIPFLLRRPYLLTRDLFVDRERPDLARLASIEEPRRFVWAILPHAARTFAACIALLPKRTAEAAAVAYLYCRMLDTYEDLVVDPQRRDDALRRFAQRFDERVGPAPEIDDGDDSHAADLRDASHLLLVRRAALVDAVYERQEAAVRELIRTLVRDMSEEMRWSSATFVAQGGVLEDEEQLARYCRGVLGHPVLFASRLLRWHQTGDPTLPPTVADQAMTVGEMIQLANVTRDIEVDLRRGIAYHPALRDDLGEPRAALPGGQAAPDVSGAAAREVDLDATAGNPAGAPDAELVERIRRVREALLLEALRRAPAYRPLIEYLSPRRLSLARASGLLMMLFTDRYFRGCARRVGRRPWGPRRGGGRLILTALPAVWSRRWATRRLEDIERDFLHAAA